jgi:hypothetical protein
MKRALRVAVFLGGIVAGSDFPARAETLEGQLTPEEIAAAARSLARARASAEGRRLAVRKSAPHRVSDRRSWVWVQPLELAGAVVRVAMLARMMTVVVMAVMTVSPLRVHAVMCRSDRRHAEKTYAQQSQKQTPEQHG